MSNPNRPPHQTLSESLAELERTNPAVREASENVDRTVRQLTGNETPAERRRRERKEAARERIAAIRAELDHKEGRS